MSVAMKAAVVSRSENALWGPNRAPPKAKQGKANK